jgi:hypothetical protein
MRETLRGASYHSGESLLLFRSIEQNEPKVKSLD